MSRILRSFISLTCVFLAACADPINSGTEPQTSPHTGNDILETEVAPVDEQPSGKVQGQVFRRTVGETFYVYATQLRVRTSPSIADLSNVAGMLNTNDEVKTAGEKLENGMIQVEIVSTAAEITAAPTYFVSAQHLSKKKQDQRIINDPQFKYFMVQNIASEKMRIYERMCDDGSCAHKMILETNIAVGEQKDSKPDMMTIAGNFHLGKWTKFYQDAAVLYPSWFDPALPMPPKPGAGVLSWTKDNVKPKGSHVRGAFGWFTAFPSGGQTNEQWTHGTLGWGSDKDKYIKATRGFWANLFADPRSHGCSRTDNESIAYIRYLLPVKTPMIKIYAREALADPTRAGYSQEKTDWQYILTKKGVRVDGEIADRETVLRNGTPKEQWLEEGTYSVDSFPDVKKFKGGGRGARAGKSANIYGLKEDKMVGYFLPDAGVVVDYQNPEGITRGGYREKAVPDFMVSKSKTFTLPK